MRHFWRENVQYFHQCLSVLYWQDNTLVSLVESGKEAKNLSTFKHKIKHSFSSICLTLLFRQHTKVCENPSSASYTSVSSTFHGPEQCRKVQPLPLLPYPTHTDRGQIPRGGDTWDRVPPLAYGCLLTSNGLQPEPGEPTAHSKRNPAKFQKKLVEGQNNIISRSCINDGVKKSPRNSVSALLLTCWPGPVRHHLCGLQFLQLWHRGEKNLGERTLQT